MFLVRCDSEPDFLALIKVKRLVLMLSGSKIITTFAPMNFCKYILKSLYLNPVRCDSAPFFFYIIYKNVLFLVMIYLLVTKVCK